MKALIQRVSASQLFELPSSGASLVSINKGLLIFVGFSQKDSLVVLEQMAQKIKTMRIFSDETGKINLAGPEVNAEYLIVSQFTLYADCKYGNRPSFAKAAEKTRAKEYYEHFLGTFRRLVGTEKVKNGPFGAMLGVELTNDGPVTIWLDSNEIL